MYKYLYMLSACMIWNASAFTITSDAVIPAGASHVYTFIAAGYTLQLKDIANQVAQPIDALRISFGNRNGQMQEIERKHVRFSIECPAMVSLREEYLHGRQLDHLRNMTSTLSISTDRFGNNQIQFIFEALKGTRLEVNKYCYIPTYPPQTGSVSATAWKYFLPQLVAPEYCDNPGAFVLSESAQRVIDNTCNNSLYYRCGRGFYMSETMIKEANRDFYNFICE